MSCADEPRNAKHVEPLCESVAFSFNERKRLTADEIDGFERGYSAGLCGRGVPRPKGLAALSASAQILLHPGFEDLGFEVFGPVLLYFAEEIAITAGWAAGDRERAELLAGTGCRR